MSVIRDLLGHHSVTLTEKYYAHLAPSNLSSAVKRLEIGEGEKSPVPKTVPSCTKNGISDSENPDDALLLTDSFERCYVPEVALLAGVAKLAYAADSKSAGVHSPWGFKSLLRHQSIILQLRLSSRLFGPRKKFAALFSRMAGFSRPCSRLLVFYRSSCS